MLDVWLSYLPLIGVGLAVVRLAGEAYLLRGPSDREPTLTQLPPGTVVGIWRPDGTVLVMHLPATRPEGRAR